MEMMDDIIEGLPRPNLGDQYLQDQLHRHKQMPAVEVACFWLSLVLFLMAMAITGLFFPLHAHHWVDALVQAAVALLSTTMIAFCMVFSAISSFYQVRGTVLFFTQFATILGMFAWIFVPVLVSTR